MQALYVVPGSVALGEPPANYAARAAALGCTLSGPTSTTPVTVFPSAVVVSSVLAPVVFPDTAGQATAAGVATAATKASSAEAKIASNLATLQSHAQAAVTANKIWLTKASKFTFNLSKTEQISLVNQVEALTRQVDALIRLTLDLLSTITGA